jgi:hypothetical protein
MLEAEYDAYGMKRIAEAYNELLRERDEAHDKYIQARAGVDVLLHKVKRIAETHNDLLRLRVLVKNAYEEGLFDGALCMILTLCGSMICGKGRMRMTK